MSLHEALAIAGAGFVAAVMNVAVGSGTLVSFPTLLAVGYPPVLANVSNAIGLVPAAFAGSWAYRRELSGQRARLVLLSSATVLGAAVGAWLLLALSSTTFSAVVPWLIILGCVLVILQPWVARRMWNRSSTASTGTGRVRMVLLWLVVFATGTYGGYFGASQGVILIAVLGLMLGEGIQRMNAAKNVLAGLANLVSGIIFAFVAQVDWAVAALIAAGALCGGLVGGGVARRLPDSLLRGLIVVIGVVAVVNMWGG